MFANRSAMGFEGEAPASACPFYTIQQPRQMDRILALSRASSLLMSLKTISMTNLSRSSFTSGGGTGNGWARSTVARAYESSAWKPELCLSSFEINLPERFRTNATFATPLCPIASGGNLLLASRRVTICFFQAPAASGLA